MDRLRKSRLYTCPECGSAAIRGLHPTTLEPCISCGSSLEGAPFAIVDMNILWRDILANIRGEFEDNSADWWKHNESEGEG